jgi:hypothetical protein
VKLLLSILKFKLKLSYVNKLPKKFVIMKVIVALGLILALIGAAAAARGSNSKYLLIFMYVCTYNCMYEHGHPVDINIY